MQVQYLTVDPRIPLAGLQPGLLHSTKGPFAPLLLAPISTFLVKHERFLDCGLFVGSAFLQVWKKGSGSGPSHDMDTELEFFCQMPSPSKYTKQKTVMGVKTLMQMQIQYNRYRSSYRYRCRDRYICRYRCTCRYTSRHWRS